MAVPGWLIAIGVGGASALGLVLLARRSKVQPGPEDDKGGGKSVCDYLKGVDEAAYASCKALEGAGEILDGLTDFLNDSTGEDMRKRDEQNKALNGDVDVPLLKAVASCMDTSAGECYDAHCTTTHVPLWGTVLRFKNGCVPFAGAPGYEKCAPGTQSMSLPYNTHSNIGDTPEPFTGRKNVGFRAQNKDMMTGARYYSGADGRINSDPATGRFSPSAAGGKCGALFPIPIPAGHVGYFVAGKPYTCPQGQVPDVARKSVTGAIPCMQIPVPQSGPVVDDEGYQTSEWLKEHMGGAPKSSTTVQCTGDFILDTLPDGTKYCRRKKAGE